MTFFIIVSNTTDRPFLVKIGHNFCKLPGDSSRVFECFGETTPVQIGWKLSTYVVGTLFRGIEEHPGTLFTIKERRNIPPGKKNAVKWICKRSPQKEPPPTDLLQVLRRAALSGDSVVIAKKKRVQGAVSLAKQLAAMKRESLNAEIDKECIVCMERDSDIVNEKCQHKTMCVPCAIAYVEKQNKDQNGLECPVCRESVTNLYLDTSAVAKNTVAESSVRSSRPLK